MDKNSKIYKISKFSPAISTENVGDYIIKEFCGYVFDELFGEALSVEIPTREKISIPSMKKIGSSDYTFVCGTNILSSNMRKFRQWNISILDAIGARCGALHKKDFGKYSKMKNAFRKTHIVLLGVGWFQYQNKPDLYTKLLFKTLLDNKMMHSVRDSYTKQMLESIGIKNVLNTACPTMWGLTPEVCSDIPVFKADSVVTTLTNYRFQAEYDQKMLQMLLDNYKEVYVWLQAIEDYTYLKQLPEINNDRLHIVAPTLTAYEALLRRGNIDYVGTRLHGGIKALNCKCRTLILAVDNRALEISKDTALPVFERSTDINIIADKINSSWETNIDLPSENIAHWKSQFV